MDKMSRRLYLHVSKTSEEVKKLEVVEEALIFIQQEICQELLADLDKTKAVEITEDETCDFRFQTDAHCHKAGLIAAVNTTIKLVGDKKLRTVRSETEALREKIAKGELSL